MYSDLPPIYFEVARQRWKYGELRHDCLKIIVSVFEAQQGHDFWIRRRGWPYVWRDRAERLRRDYQPWKR